MASGVYLALVEVKRLEGLRKLVGYAAANAVLERLSGAVETCLASCLRVGVGRTRLEIALSGASHEEVADDLTALCVALAQRMDIEGYEFDLEVTIGAADSGGRPIGPELIERAEEALLLTAKLGRACVLGPPALDGGSGDRLTLMRDLQHAIANDGLALHYQPKVRARTGAVAGVEGLVRWPDPRRGMVAPDRFISLAEDTGDIRSLTEWVIGRAIRDQAILRRAGFVVPMHINLSGALLADKDYGWDVLQCCTAVQGELGFEITETAMIADPKRALANMLTFAEAGVKLAIDDYGSGSSSLSYLQQLPVDELKIDRTFIMRLATSQRDPLLVRSTIDLAHALEMEVTAEGVESPAVMALLQVMGCDMLQGFLFARALPLAELEAFLIHERDAQGTVVRPPQRLTKRARRNSPSAAC